MYAKYFGLEELPFSVTPDPRFFFNNSLYREAFASLRYGIETRKGFIVITGEAGTGKTTLLRRLMRSVEATVHTAFIFNTHLSFSELLRLVLNDLGIASTARDKMTLMAQLNDYLIEQLEKDHIVSVLVDEAQDLSDEMLEELRLLSNLETDRAKLIQIVLMGQPELEQKLDQPELRQLKQRVAMRCRLAPLSSDEVAPYINSRLQTVGYQGKELFDLGSLQKIALYSKGIPRLINVICDNALLIAYATSETKVSAKIIDEVARDLQLLEPPRVKGVEKRKEPSRQTRAQLEEATWRSDFEEFPPTGKRPATRLRNNRTLAGVGIGVLLALVILAGTVLYSQQSGSLAALGVNLEDLVGAGWRNPSPIQTQPTPEAPKGEIPTEERVAGNELYVQTPSPQVPESSTSELHQDASIPKIDDPSKLSPAVNAAENRRGEDTGTVPDQTRTTAKNRNQAPILNSNAPVTAEKLELEIYKAINNRAIRGVEVSVVDGTAYLAGRVESDKQKLVAVQAARSVPGVKDVRNEITVNSLYDPGKSP
jgi:general secretion pathway protein A